VAVSRADDNPFGAANALLDTSFVHQVSGNETASARSLDAARRLFAQRGATRCVELSAKWAGVPGQAVKEGAL
jgi:hypothetical protein